MQGPEHLKCTTVRVPKEEGARARIEDILQDSLMFKGASAWVHCVRLHAGMHLGAVAMRVCMSLCGTLNL